jgi:hypothetical protein
MDVELPGSGRVVAADRDGQFTVDDLDSHRHASDGDGFLARLSWLA